MYIGADPEVFLQDAAGGLVSSIGRIGGTKDAPRPIKGLAVGYAVQEDNVALEYNIPPAKTAQELVRKIKTAMRALSREVAKQGLEFNRSSAVFFPKEQLNNPKALEFGCDPDYNAWTGDVNPRPCATDATLRSCGGHIHVGAEFDDMLKFIKRCDLYLAVPSVLMDQGQLRKQLYGKAGAFRPKPYGAEYRVLSNFWIFDDKTVEWAYNNTQRALDAKLVNVDQEQEAILDAVNNNNADAAKHLIEKYNIPVVYA